MDVGFYQIHQYIILFINLKYQLLVIKAQNKPLFPKIPPKDLVIFSSQPIQYHQKHYENIDFSGQSNYISCKLT